MKLCILFCSATKAGERVQRVLKDATEQMLVNYYEHAPTAVRVMQRVLGDNMGVKAVHHDHFAFRTFGSPGLGLADVGRVLAHVGVCSTGLSAGTLLLVPQRPATIPPNTFTCIKLEHTDDLSDVHVFSQMYHIHTLRGGSTASSPAYVYRRLYLQLTTLSPMYPCSQSTIQ